MDFLHHECRTPRSYFFPLVTTLSLVIPAFNEHDRLGKTLESIITAREALERGGLSMIQVLVVDDGSTDDTRAIAQSFSDRLPITVLRLAKNKGKGAAVRAGMLQSTAEYALMYDADGATPITEVPKLFTELLRSRADIAIGSRVMNQSASLVSMRWHRRLIGRVYHFFCQSLVPGIQDTACGCKLFSGDAAKTLFSLQTIDRFAFDVEVLALAQMYGYRIVEVPVAWTAVPESKVRIVRDGLQMLLCVIRLYRRSGKLTADAHRSAPLLRDEGSSPEPR